MGGRFDLAMKHVFALVFLTVGAAHAQQQSRFDQWDRNKDGKLTRDELPRGLQRNFDRVDADKDGFISREENAAFLKQRSAPRVPDGYEHIANINYAGGKNPRQGLDLILPKDRAKAEQPSPLLVFIHGGAWRNGSKEGGIRRLGDILVKTGFAGATINYRLSGEAQWPAQVHDCKAAIRWLRANSEKHGYDGDKIAVWGSSAGGHLVAMLGATGGVKEFEGDIGNHDATNSRVQAVVDYFGPSELLTMNDHESSIDHNASDSPESRLIGGAIQENKEKANNASPMTWVTKDDAPHLIVHGDRDMLVPFPQSKNYDARLDAAGVRSNLIHIEGGGHGQGFDTEKLTPLIVAFLEKELLGKERKVEEAKLKALPRRR